MKKLFASLAPTTIAAPVWVATQPAMLSVLNMTCSARPITVKKTISKVDGVNRVTVTFETCEAVVTFDGIKISVQELTKTTGDVGYPSSVKQRATEPDPGAIMELITHIVDKTGMLGNVTSVMNCATCFPVITSLGAVIELGLLQGCKGLFIFMLLPLFAVVTSLASTLGQLSHRQWHRSLLGMIRPAIVLAGIVWLFGNW